MSFQFIQSFYEQALNLIKYMILIMGAQLIILVILSLFIELGPESKMNGWVEAFSVPPVVAVLLYHYYRFKKEYFKILSFSLFNIALLIAEIYVYIEILKWDIAFGFMIIILTGVFTPLNFLMVNLVIGRRR